MKKKLLYLMCSFQNRTINQVVRNSIERRHRLLSVCRSVQQSSFSRKFLTFCKNFQEQHQVMADVDEEFEGVTRRLIQFDHVISSYFYIAKVVFKKVVKFSHRIEPMPNWKNKICKSSSIANSNT